MQRVVLLDMDNVLADFDKSLVSVCTTKGYTDLLKNYNCRTTMKMQDSVSIAQVNEIMSKHGFFYNLPVIDGCLQAIKEMKAEGYHLVICTTPTNGLSIVEKYDWVQDNIGPEFVNNVITTTDKTLIQGDYLIDDNHQITGINKTPQWKQILFDRDYNRGDTTLPRMVHWKDWRQFIK